MKVIAESDKKKAVELYSTGNYSLAQIGEMFGVCDAAILKWMKRFGVENVRRRGRWHGRDEMNKKVVEDYLNGVDITEISNKYSITTRTVHDLVKKSGNPARGGIGAKYGINNDIKQKAIDLYQTQQLNCCEIENILGVSNKSINTWIKDIKRSASEISAITSYQGKRKCQGKMSIENTRFGEIRCDCSYESSRIRQLEKDSSIISVERCPFIIPYQLENEKKRHYNPDFFIKYADGRKIVEEIKNSNTKERKINNIKHNTAENFLSELGIEFRIVTEKETDHFTK